MPLGEEIVADYQTARLSLKGHPLEILRPALRRERIASCAETEARPDASFVRTAGIVLVRQRPGNGKAIFITIEDETGIANLIVWPQTLERFRRAALGATLLYCRGRLQREESVIHLVADELRDWTRWLNTLHDRTGDEPLPPRRKPPFAIREKPPGHDPRDLVIPSRDFR